MYGVCVFDDPNDRVLKEYFFTSPELTIEMCLAVCRDKGFRYSGLQWQIECHCGNEPTGAFQWAWLGKCNDKCAGNSNQVCGGSHAMSVYTTRGDHKAYSNILIDFLIMCCCFKQLHFLSAERNKIEYTEHIKYPV